MRLLKLLLILFVCAAGPAVAGPLDDVLTVDNGISAAQKAVREPTQAAYMPIYAA